MPGLNGRRTILGSLAGWLFAALLVSGCSHSQNAGPTSADGDVVVAHNSQVVPGRTLTDLVTYGDVATVFKVVSERELSPSQEELDRGEGVIVRQVVARQVSTAVAWKRSSNTDATTPPKQWNISNGGWVFHGSERRQIVDEGSQPLEVGKEYLAIRTHTSIAGTEPVWFSLFNFPLVDSRVHLSSDMLSRLSSKSIAGAQGLSTRELGALLKATPPDPRAVPYMDLDAFERYQQVVS